VCVAFFDYFVTYADTAAEGYVVLLFPGDVFKGGFNLQLLVSSGMIVLFSLVCLLLSALLNSILILFALYPPINDSSNIEIPFSLSIQLPSVAAYIPRYYCYYYCCYTIPLSLSFFILSFAISKYNNLSNAFCKLFPTSTYLLVSNGYTSLIISLTFSKQSSLPLSAVQCLYSLCSVIVSKLRR